MRNYNEVKCIYLYADWDRGHTKKNNEFYEEVKKFPEVRYEVLNVEEEDGLNLSIKHQIRNVPALLVFVNGRLKGIEKGNHCHELIANYIW